MPTCQIIGLTTMFHRVIGLSSVLLVCLAGCSLCSHQGSGYCQHGHQHGNSGSLNAACGEDLACTCAAPLYPGDQNGQHNCKKHHRQPPMQRMATAFRRSSSKWMSGPHASGCPCGSGGHETYVSQPMMWEQDACGQTGCGVQQVCGVLPACGVDQAWVGDSCAPTMTGGWSSGGFPAGGEFYATADPGSTGCNCGQQHSTNGSMYIPEGDGSYEYSTEAPMLNVPANVQGNTVPRSFPPAQPFEAPATPDPLSDTFAKPFPVPPGAESAAPIPQDLTPMDPPVEFPKNATDQFDPLQEEGAPAADKVLDPVRFDIPRLPPLPEQNRSSVKRGGFQPVVPIATDSEQFQR